MSTPTFFSTPSTFRAWLTTHHREARELWVGFHKRHTGKPSVTWPEAVDEALCFGWIDGLRKRINETSYVIRFTPRKPRSTWSAVNIARAKHLVARGRMAPAGLEAFEKRSSERSAIYSYEQRRTATLDAAQTKQFRKHARAWAFFRAQPPSYRHVAMYWVVSAKKEETRARRLAALIASSAAGRKLGQFTPS